MPAAGWLQRAAAGRHVATFCLLLCHVDDDLEVLRLDGEPVEAPGVRVDPLVLQHKGAAGAELHLIYRGRAVLEPQAWGSQQEGPLGLQTHGCDCGNDKMAASRP